jgi:hypothetical protein
MGSFISVAFPSREGRPGAEYWTVMVVYLQRAGPVKGSVLHKSRAQQMIFD